MDCYLAENLFGIDGLNIAWYGVIIALGMLLGGALAIFRCKNAGVDKDHIYNFGLILIPVSIVCARAYYVIFEWDNYKDNWLDIFAINQGGLAIYGGVIGGVITAAVYCKVKKISFLSFADILIPSLVLGQFIGRWGNYVNQEAFGNLITNTRLQFFPYGIYIEELGEWHQATFFYESSLNFILLITMLSVYPHLKQKGYLLSFYMIGYGTIRFFVEGLRADSLYIAPGLRVSQLLSLILVVGGLILVGHIKKSQTVRKVSDNE